MDERTPEQLAVLVGGEAWQSGGGIYLVTVNWDDGSLVVFPGDAICEYENDEAFDAGRASKTILLNIAETEDLYVIVDLKGNVFYQDNAMERAAGGTKRMRCTRRERWSHGERADSRSSSRANCQPDRSLPGNLRSKVFTHHDPNAEPIRPIHAVAIYAGLHADPAARSEVVPSKEPGHCPTADLWPACKAARAIETVLEPLTLGLAHRGEWCEQNRLRFVDARLVVLECGMSTSELQDDGTNTLGFWIEADLAFPLTASGCQAGCERG